MNAIDILGDLLGHKTSGGGLGGDVLKDIFRRGSTPKRGSANRGSANRQSKPASSRDIQQDAEDLEDLLNVANDRSSQRTHSSGRHENRPHQSTHQAPPISVPTSRPSGRSQHRSAERSLEKDNQHAEILIEAMLNAAKSDGEINPEEQRAIMKRLDNQPREALEFVRNQMEAPLDLDSFVRKIPLGMEKQVYTMSLIAINLDTRGEANYLLDLASGLRLDSDTCEQIHRQVGAPSLK